MSDTTDPTTQNPMSPTVPPIPVVTDMDDVPPPPSGNPPQPVVSDAPPSEPVETPAQNLDLPPVISTTGTTGKKNPKGRMVATILGFLMLIGGLGAGVILTQQQQDIREKAAVGVADGRCLGPGESCASGKSHFDNTCTPTDERCGTKGGSADTVGDGRCLDPGQSCASGKSYTDNTCTPTGERCGTKPVETGLPGEGDLCGPNDSCAKGLECNKNKICKTPDEADRLPRCPNTDCNIPSNVSGRVACELTNGQESYCCPTGKPLYNSTTKTCGTSSTSAATGGGACTSRLTYTDPEYGQANVNSSQITITQDWINRCNNICSIDKGSAQLYASKCACGEIGLTSGCNTGCSLQNGLKAGDVVSMPVPTCGTTQIDIGCKDVNNTYGSVAFAEKTAATACNTATTPKKPGGGGGDEVSAQCLNVKAYNAQGQKLSVAQLSQLKAGDTVRFSVAGTATGGSFTKARFTINGSQRPETSKKISGTDEFYDDYVIPAGVTSFTVSAKIFHSSLGYF